MKSWLIESVPAEVWNRICNYSKLKAVRALYTTNRHFHRITDLPAFLLEHRAIRSLILLNPDYPPLHRYLNQIIERISSPSIRKGKIYRNDCCVLFRALKVALSRGHWPLIQLLVPVFRTQKAQLTLIGIVFDIFKPTSDLMKSGWSLEECEKLLVFFLNCWIQGDAKIRLLWLIMRQAFLWNAHMVIDCCFKWLDSQEQDSKIKETFIDFLYDRDPAMRHAWLAKEKPETKTPTSRKVKEFYENAAFVDEKRRFLHGACRLGRVDEITRLLSDPEAVLDRKDLDVACRNGHLKIVKILLNDDRLDLSHDPSSALLSAISNRQFEIALRLLDDPRIEPVSFSANYLVMMIHDDEKNFELFERFLQHPRLDISLFHDSLHLTAGNGPPIFFQRFLQELDQADNICALLKKSFLSAARNGRVEILDMILQDPRFDFTACAYEALLEATQYDENIPVVERLLQDKHLDPSSCSGEVLIRAASNGHTEVVRRLLKDSRIDPSVCKNKALHSSLEEGHLDVVKLILNDHRICIPLLENSAISFAANEANAHIAKHIMLHPSVGPSIGGFPALISASKAGKVEVVEILLTDARLDPSGDDNQAIILAAGGGHHEIVRLLLKHPKVNPSAREYHAIRVAALSFHFQVVGVLARDPRIQCDPKWTSDDGDNLLLDFFRIGNLNGTMDGIISKASECGLYEIVDQLIKDDRVNPAERNNQPLINAAKGNHIQVVERLLQDPRVDPVDQNNCALAIASRFGHVKIVQRLLLDPRVDPAYDDNDAILYACSEGHLEVVRILLADKRADPFYDDGPLEKACEKGHVEVVKALLNDPRFDPKLETLHFNDIFRAASKQSDALNLLLDNTGINEDYGTVLLWDASETGDLEVVKRLLAHPRIDPSFSNNEALQFALECEHSEVVDCLLSDPRVDPSSLRRLGFAISGDHWDGIMRLLKDPRYDPSVNCNELIQNVCKKANCYKVVQSLLHDPRVDPSAGQSRALCNAAAIDQWATVDLLLEDPRVDATADHYYVIRRLFRNRRLHESITKDMWNQIPPWIMGYWYDSFRMAEDDDDEDDDEDTGDEEPDFGDYASHAVDFSDEEEYSDEYY